MIGYGNSMFLATHGILARTASGGGVDPDAQAFITAASITDPTQQSAINQLVVDLKGYGVWTKMKAIYPFVGGTAAQHKWNLKDPRDLDAAFRLVFNGGWTHSSTGATPNGTNAYADSKFVPSTHLGVNSNSLGYYSGTNLSETISDPCNIGAFISVTQGLVLAKTNTLFAGRLNGSAITYSTTTMRGFFSASRQSSTLTDIYLNGSQVGTGNSGGTLPNNNVLLGTISIDPSSNPYGSGYVKNDFRFTYLADGLNDTETANFYTAVQAFQTTLGRSIGTQTVSDADAQAFVTNAGIVDQVEANAVNNLVIGLKADSLWTKMKAVYPFVGGTASAHKFNLKDPRDLDAAFRLVFNGGITHSSTGALPNGLNGLANTFLNATTVLTNSNLHLSWYSRTASTIGGFSSEILPSENYNVNSWVTFRVNNKVLGNAYFSAGNDNAGATVSQTQSGFFIGSETASNLRKLYRNGTAIAINTTNDLNALSPAPLNLWGYTTSNYSGNNCAFASIGDGLSDTDATNLNSRVTTFQTALNRNV